MKHSLLILLILSTNILFAQNNVPPSIKTKETLKNDHCIELTEKDERGNTVFQLKEIHNITTQKTTNELIVYRYDNLNRETLSLTANNGLDVIETIYEPNRILTYYATSSELKEKDMKALTTINSAEDLWELNSSKKLLAGKRKLFMISLLDSNKNTTEISSFLMENDTVKISYQYNKNNKLILSESKNNHSDQWYAREYYEYDDRMNMIHSYKSEAWDDDTKETTDVHNNTYNADSLLLSTAFYYRGEFRNKTEYTYNENRQITKETYYQEDNSTPLRITTYEYDKQGLLIKSATEDFTYDEPKKEILFFRYIIW